MNSFAPRCCCLLLFTGILALSCPLAVAKEPVVTIKPAAAAPKKAAKSPANDPWQISLTVRKDQPAAKPGARVSPLSVRPLTIGTLNGGASNGALPVGVASPFFSVGAFPGATTNFSLPTSAMGGPAVGQGSPVRQGSLGISGGGNPALPSMLGSPSGQPTVMGDASGNGNVDFVDVGAAMQQLGDSSAAVQLGGDAK